MARRRPTSRVGAPAPLGLEKQLARALRPMIRQVRASLARVSSTQDLTALQAAVRRTWPESRIRALVEEIARKAEAAGSRPWRALERAAARSAATSDAARTDVDRRKPFDGGKLIDEWSKDAAKRITSVRDELVEGMRGDLVDALEKGRPASALTKKWVAKGIPVKFGTLEGRMKVIAQNQLGILHAKVQSERARSLGVREFIWRTQGDDRVRDAHRALAGTKHRYDDPPSEGLPGTPINCRCWAESVIGDDLLGELGIGAGRLFGSAQPSP